MCLECGAPDDECTVRFDECVALEFEDASYGTVHHLTVSTYMLQHSSKLTREAWLYERDLLKEFLDGNKSPERIRQERRDTVDNGTRTFKIKSRDGLPVLPQTAWAKTILDIRTETPEEYRQDVMDWAKATLRDSEIIEISS